jgi:putative pyruvate formate lyase activating enzyme
MSAWEPPYVALHEAGELAARAARALELLDGHCRVCPRLCKVDRLADRPGLCKIGREAVVASHFAHFGEENCLRGARGSGTVFFGGCNLRCVFCQNHEISWQPQGERVGRQRLAEMMLELQQMGCHNINWVTPEHVVPQILEALPLAVEAGLRLPIIYNTSAYDSLDSLELMEGIVDVYMPDFKLWSSDLSRRYLAKRDYAEVARRTVKEMHRQVGELRFDECGLARRGLLVRHLVMPGLAHESEAILRWIADELGPDTYVDVMAQYYPAGRTDEFPEIDRRLYRPEFEHALAVADGLGLRRLDRRSRASVARLADAPV